MQVLRSSETRLPVLPRARLTGRGGRTGERPVDYTSPIAGFASDAKLARPASHGRYAGQRWGDRHDVAQSLPSAVLKEPAVTAVGLHAVTCLSWATDWGVDRWHSVLGHRRARGQQRCRVPRAKKRQPSFGPTATSSCLLPSREPKGNRPCALPLRLPVSYGRRQEDEGGANGLTVLRRRDRPASCRSRSRAPLDETCARPTITPTSRLAWSVAAAR